EVLAMHISTKETAEKDQEILQEFADYFPNITLKNINTSYRDIITPSVKYVKRIAQEAKQKNYTVTVLVPQFIPNKPW
ncbi:amino acid permease, partial [Streptococcus pneumoniae]|nr:amino acid permease [Streptococcus pneumoniae]